MKAILSLPVGCWTGVPRSRGVAQLAPQLPRQSPRALPSLVHVIRSLTFAAQAPPINLALSHATRMIHANSSVSNNGSGAHTNGASDTPPPSSSTSSLSGMEESSTEMQEVYFDSTDLFLDLSEGEHSEHYPSNRNSASNVPRKEPTTEAGQQAAENRRRLFSRCSNLSSVVETELHAEVARDMADGVAAVPPLAPAGWRVLHDTGSSFFTMHRVLPGATRTEKKDSLGDSAEEEDALPRYRSVHDVMAGVSPARRRRPYNHSGDGSAPARNSINDVVGGEGGGRASPASYTRSDTHVTIFAPFRTLDLTLYDPSIGICEWSRFDVLVRKTAPSPGAGSFLSSTVSRVQQQIYDDRQCMFLRLACVNGELRVRSLQFLSHKLAHALEAHAVFGKGEPLYLELRRRQREEKSVRRADKRGMWQTAVLPVQVLDAPQVQGRKDRHVGNHTPAMEGSQLEAGLFLTERFDRAGDYARTFAYSGPCFTELSKELQDALLSYLMVQLGVSNEVTEYVCQLQYFLEQEEYVGWLAQWGQLASTLQQTL